MNVGELFVDLGVKGGDKAVGALGEVKEGMGKLKSVSFETKAALAGVLYGLERMMSSSAQFGANLTNFNSLTGVSVQRLQQWQYAGRQVNATNEEVAGSFKSVQDAMTEMHIKGHAPGSFGLVSSITGMKWEDTFNPEKVLLKLQEFSQKVRPEIASHVLKEWGVAESVAAGMHRGAFNEDIFKKAPAYKDGELKQLNKVNAGLANLMNKISMQFGRFTAKHGTEIIADLDKITGAIFKLADALATLAEKAKVFQAIGWGVEKTAQITTLAAIGVDDISGTHSPKDNAALGKDSTLKKIMDFRDSVDKSVLDFIKGQIPQGAARSTSNTVNVTQNITAHGDANGAKHIADLHKKAATQAHKQIQNAGRQSSAPKLGP